MSSDRLLYPCAADMDFALIAHRLGRINLFHDSEKPVSAAQHVLISCDALADPALLPWALVADCWKATLGDVEDFFFGAVLELAKTLSAAAQAVIRAEWLALKGRHRAAIHEAAGLPLPAPEAAEIVAGAALVAAATERRDFGVRRPGAGNDYPPLRKVYRLRAAEDVSASLLAKFKANLPCFRAVRRAGAACQSAAAAP